MNTFKSIAANFDTKKAIQALQAYGIQLYTTNENGMKVMRDGANVFGELQNLFTKLDDEGKRKLAMSLSGGKFQVNQLQAFLADTNQNFSKIMDEMKNKSSDAMTQQLLAVSMSTYQTKIAQLKASLQVLAQTLGNQVLPYLKNFAITLTGTAMFLQQHSAAIMSVAKAAFYLAGAYIAVQVATFAFSAVTGTVAIVMAALTASVDLATKGTWAFQLSNVAATISSIAMAGGAAIQALAVGDLAGAWDILTVAMAANPIGLAIIAITALGVAVYELYNNWSSVKQSLIDFWNELVNVVANNIDKIMVLFPPLGAAIFIISTLWGPMVGYISGLWNEIVGIVSGGADLVVKFISYAATAWGPFVDAAKEGISNFLSAIGDVFPGLTSFANGVIDVFVQLGNKVSAIATQIGNNIRNALSINGASGSSMGDYARSEYGDNGQTEEDPYAKAKRLSDASYNAIVNNGAITAPQLSAPSIGNQIPESGGGKGKHGGAGGKGETEYQQAKKAYEAAVAQGKYDAESSGKKWTANDQLYLYQSYLTDITKLDDAHHQETLDYEKGEFELKRKNIEEQIKLKAAQYERETALARAGIDSVHQIEKQVNDKVKAGTPLNEYEMKIYTKMQESTTLPAGSAEKYKNQAEEYNDIAKENLAVRQANLQKSIAEERLTKRAAYDEEIKLLQDATKEQGISDAEKIKRETAVINKQHEEENHLMNIAQKEAEINRQYLSDMQSLIDKQTEYDEKLHLISEQQMIANKTKENGSTFTDKNSQNENAIGKTALPGKESEMFSLYRQYQQAKTEIQREELENQMINISKANEKTLAILAKGEQDWAAYEKKKQELSEETYEYVNRYQISFIDAYQSSLAEAMNNTLNKTKSWSDNIRSIFSSLWKAIGNQFSQDFAKKWTQSLSQIVLGSKRSNNEVETFGQQLTTSLAQERQKQLTGETQKNQTKTTLNQTSDTAIKTSAQQTTTSVLGSLGQIMTQMLETMAIMAVISSLFGGGGSSTSTSTSTVSLGRSESSYYTTPAAVQQITIPSFDIGAQQLPEDMLAMVHKNEMILEPRLADNIRSLGSSSNNSNNNNVSTRPMKMNANFYSSAIDNRGMEQMFKGNIRELSKGVTKAVRYGSLSKKSIT